MLYVDDLKLFAANHEHMKTNLRIIEKFSKNIQMEFEIEKCATVEIRQGKNIQLTDSHQIRSLEIDEFCKYLGMEEKKWCKQQGHERKCKKILLPTNKNNIDNPIQHKEQNHGH